MNLINLTTDDLHFYKNNPLSRKDKTADILPSLKKYGLLSPLVIEKITEGRIAKYYTTDGNRRLAAVGIFEELYAKEKKRIEKLKDGKTKTKLAKQLEYWSKFFNEEDRFIITCLERTDEDIEICKTEEYFTETNKVKRKITGRENQEMFFQTKNPKLINKALFNRITLLSELSDNGIDEVKEYLCDKKINISTFCQVLYMIYRKLEIDVKKYQKEKTDYEHYELMVDTYNWLYDNYANNLIELRDVKLKKKTSTKEVILEAIENNEIL